MTGEESHRLTVEGRQKLTMTGVTEVLGFEETAVVAETVLGTAVIRGEELRLRNLDRAQIVVEGRICSVSYEEPSAGGFWRRFFG